MNTEDPRYLRVSSGPEWTRVSIVDGWGDTLAGQLTEELTFAVVSAPTPGILLDLTTCSAVPRPFELFSLAETLAEECVRAGKRIAVVADAANHSSLQFFENVAVNRGLKLAVFASEELAVSWLGQKA